MICFYIAHKCVHLDIEMKLTMIPSYVNIIISWKSLCKRMISINLIRQHWCTWFPLHKNNLVRSNAPIEEESNKYLSCISKYILVIIRIFLIFLNYKRRHIYLQNIESEHKQYICDKMVILKIVWHHTTTQIDMFDLTFFNNSYDLLCS